MGADGFVLEGSKKPNALTCMSSKQRVHVGSVRYRFRASRAVFAWRNSFTPHSRNRFSALNGIFPTRRDWAGVKGSTSSYHPLTRILSAGFLIVESAQMSLQAGFSTRGA